VVNGGGHVDRGYGAGRGRIDILVRWPYQTPAGKRAVQRKALELTVWRPDKPDPLAEGLAQLDSYLDQHPCHQHPCHQHPGHRFANGMGPRIASGMGPRIASGPGPRIGLDTGVLVVFDRRPEAAPIAERTAFAQATGPSGRPVTALRG
jgi:hypothetical protein